MKKKGFYEIGFEGKVFKVPKEFLNKFKEEVIQHTQEEALHIIKTYQNPYPKDIFSWYNEGKLDFSRGRFNKHCHKIVESMRSDLLKEIEENN